MSDASLAPYGFGNKPFGQLVSSIGMLRVQIVMRNEKGRLESPPFLQKQVEKFTSYLPIAAVICWPTLAASENFLDIQ